jgi:hypothetical protein
MSRWREPDEREQENEKSDVGIGDALSRGGGDTRPRHQPDEAEMPGFGDNRREIILLRERPVYVRPSERETLRTLGRFRVVDAEDLVGELYRGDRSLARADFEALRRQGLIRTAIVPDEKGRRSEVMTLTRDGAEVARAFGTSTEALYRGFARPAEVAHDSRYYRAFRHEERRLRAEGKRIERVVLDYELKRAYFARLNARERPGSYRDRQDETARAIHLKVMNGHTVFPDFRIECKNERGETERVDVEIASDHYRDHHLGAKMSAGFRVYAGERTATRLAARQTALGNGRFTNERSAVLLL